MRLPEILRNDLGVIGEDDLRGILDNRRAEVGWIGKAALHRFAGIADEKDISLYPRHSLGRFWLVETNNQIRLIDHVREIVFDRAITDNKHRLALVWCHRLILVWLKRRDGGRFVT
jgi:hypothetical protein